MRLFQQTVCFSEMICHLFTQHSYLYRIMCAVFSLIAWRNSDIHEAQTPLRSVVSVVILLIGIEMFPISCFNDLDD